MPPVYWKCVKCEKSGEVEPSGNTYRDDFACYEQHRMVAPDCLPDWSMLIGNDPKLVEISYRVPKPVAYRDAESWQPLSLGEVGFFTTSPDHALRATCITPTGLLAHDHCVILHNSISDPGEEYQAIATERLQPLEMIACKLRTDFAAKSWLELVVLGPGISVYNGHDCRLEKGRTIRLWKFAKNYFVAPMEDQ